MTRSQILVVAALAACGRKAAEPRETPSTPPAVRPSGAIVYESRFKGPDATDTSLVVFDLVAGRGFDLGPLPPGGPHLTTMLDGGKAAMIATGDHTQLVIERDAAGTWRIRPRRDELIPSLPVGAACPPTMMCVSSPSGGVLVWTELAGGAVTLLSAKADDVAHPHRIPLGSDSPTSCVFANEERIVCPFVKAVELPHRLVSIDLSSDRMLELVGGDLQRSPVISPDARYVAFLSGTPQATSLMTTSLDGKGAITLISSMVWPEEILVWLR